MNKLQYGKAICYSGYRKDQSPIDQTYPSYFEILEDLKILEKDFDYIRMYDASEHCKMTLDVIKYEKINLKVLIGIDLLGEISNSNCSWGGTYTDEEISKHIEYNQNQLNRAIELANEYKEHIIGVSAGNEAVPTWNENLVSPSRVLYFVKQLKKYTSVPVTYCDSAWEWKGALKDVAKEVDYISIHIYPVWHKKGVNEGIDICKNEYDEINELYPNKQVIITETGWPTCSNGGNIPEELANETNQLLYNKVIDEWSFKNEVVTFFFEAFDEPWKGSSNAKEPEKHWGYYFVNREPKLIKK